MIAKSFLLATALVVLSTNASGEAALIRLEYEISLDGNSVAAPLMVVKEGEQASFKLEGPNSQKVALSVMAIRSSNRAIQLRHLLSIGAEQWTPELVVRQDEPGSIQIGALEISILASDYQSDVGT